MIRKLFIIFAIAFSAAVCGLVDGGQEQCCGQDAGKNANVFKRGRGYKAPSDKVSAERHANSDARHAERLKRLRKATPQSYDCRTLGQVGPIKDQNQCGDCYIFSGSGVCESAQFTAGIATSTSGFGLSEQYMLDCGNVGGCNGGDEWQVAQLILTNGTPSIAAAPAGYPGLGQVQGNCQNTNGLTLYKIADMGFCTVNAGANSVANTQDMKNCIVQYGPISVAVDASTWGDPGSTVLSGQGSQCDHAVIIIGWDDTKGNGGAWLVRNSWGPNWGMQGYAWVQYGSFLIGTEAFWVTQTPLPPPPGKGPTPGTYTLVVNPDGTSTLTPAATPTSSATGTYTVNSDGSITLTPATNTATPKKKACTDTQGKELAVAAPTSVQRRITWWEKNTGYATKP